MNGLLTRANGNAHPLFTIVIMRNIKVSLSSGFSQRLSISDCRFVVTTGSTQTRGLHHLPSTMQ